MKRLRVYDIDTVKHTITIDGNKPAKKGTFGDKVVSVSSRFGSRTIRYPSFLHDDIMKAVKGRISSDILLGFGRTELYKAIHEVFQETDIEAITLTELRDSGIIYLIEHGIGSSSIALHTGLSIQAVERKYGRYFMESEKAILQCLENSVRSTEEIKLVEVNEEPKPFVPPLVPREEAMKMDVYEFAEAYNLPKATAVFLEKNGYRTVADIDKTPWQYIWSIPTISKRRLTNLWVALANAGVKNGREADPMPQTTNERRTK